MIQELEFKAWSHRDNCFIAAFAINKHGFFRESPVMNWIILNQQKEIEVVPFIGVSIKSGRRIFLKDILAIPDTDTEFIHGQGSGPTYPISHLVEVVFQDGCFGVMITNRNGDNFAAGFLPLSELMLDSRWPEVEIIGNSFENPEYLKG